jgi:hypothetical protein
MLATDTPHWTGQAARISMSGMFANTTNLTGIFSHWDMSQVINLVGMFQNAKGFNQPLN